ncbi:amidohydrolase family protein [Sporolactobacillus sp. CQH2019]|uniref:amidohydrolase family protein n=1 Tax=Sporolactobacillus sp. CQH2019 TaxID=3023512 RepID=UPI002367EA1C|nr:amidohydrolase family protein [Sporolactobacillus sp. CQH2019]MDD9150790.1 amidohydrolase family protein [Sporolactobacillus sp. CQH2019]
MQIMQNKIALEEHYEMFVDTTVMNLLAESEGFDPDYLADVTRRAQDIDMRVEEMDRNGIGTMILSPSPPGPEMVTDAGRSVDLARRMNDHAANLVAKYPARLRAFAAVPLQDPEKGADELERAVRDLGFVGALINGFSNIGDEDTALYLDEPQVEPFWARVEQLGVPVYLHPRPPLPSMRRAYQGYQGLNGSAWGFNVETATHALRLMLSGLFDRHPGINVIIGHMGEMLPFQLPRVDHRLRHLRPGTHGNHQKLLTEYLRTNFYITTAGVFQTSTLLNALQEVGTDRVLFSVDTPWESADETCPWFDTCPISENDRWKIGRTNAEQLFGFKHVKSHGE